jgi:FkbM family methyltransferase
VKRAALIEDQSQLLPHAMQGPLIKRLIPLRVKQRLAAYGCRLTGEDEYRLLPSLCRHDRISLDIGAHRGMYTYWCRRYSSSVIAFEPSPDLCARLRGAFPRDVDVRQCVVSDSSGTTTLRIPVVEGEIEFALSSVEAGNELGGYSFQEITVDKFALDDLNLRDVGFIKVDVEGHELSVLQGAKSLLQREQPRILVECEERHRASAVKSVSDFLRFHGFRGFYLYGNKLTQLDFFNAKKLQDPSVIRLGQSIPGSVYVNNFVFIHESDKDWRFGTG